MARASRLGHNYEGKNSVRNLGPQTRLRCISCASPFAYVSLGILTLGSVSPLIFFQVSFSL